MKTLLHRIALRLETWADRLFVRRSTAQIIDPYIGYATGDTVRLRGRVLSASTRQQSKAGQGRLANLRQMVGLFLTDEVAGTVVHCEGATATSDEEGYFTLTLPRPATTGWFQARARIDGSAEDTHLTARIPDPDAQFMVISDIDDTVLKTGAYTLWKNLWTSMTGNALTRDIFPDAVALMDRLAEGGRNPIFYVSSSPWNLHGFLSDIFARHDLERGPMFLRDLGLSETQFISGTHGDHKGQSIDTILKAVPDVPAILIGDTGQHDAHVYLDAIRRHPTRIAAVVLREPGPGPNAQILDDMQAIRNTGIPLFHGTDFYGMAPEAEVA